MLRAMTEVAEQYQERFRNAFARWKKQYPNNTLGERFRASRRRPTRADDFAQEQRDKERSSPSLLIVEALDRLTTTLKESSPAEVTVRAPRATQMPSQTERYIHSKQQPTNLS